MHLHFLKKTASKIFDSRTNMLKMSKLIGKKKVAANNNVEAG